MTDATVQTPLLSLAAPSAVAATQKASTSLLALGALGVVYGDIGTSPLYALREAAKAAAGGQALTQGAAIAATSAILWALLVVVALKYAMLILRADNQGEGGIMAMLALLHARATKPGKRGGTLLVTGLIGAALLYGDGAITPAVSVLSAIEGLKADAPSLTRLVVPLTVGVILILFWSQRLGTARIAKVFAPVMLLWFVAIAVLGVTGIVLAPGIVAAFNPLAAWHFFRHAGFAIDAAVLGAAFLAVTGGEAMYADLGHFGAGPIRLAWFAVVLPALLLNYLGQGALLMVEPKAIDNPFYRLAPGWAHYPLIAFATAATVIASQSIISGAFSLTRQAVQLGFLPRLRVIHTDATKIGQVYLPFVNVALAVATIAAVIGFGSSDALAGAYGVAVSLLMVITTLLAGFIARQWGFPLWVVLLVNGFFVSVDLAFFAANSLKIVDGGLFPLLIATGIAVTMLTWRRGVQLVEVAREKVRQPHEAFVARLASDPPIRLPGTAAFLTPSVIGVPLALSRLRDMTGAIPEAILLVSVVPVDVPSVAQEDRAKITQVAERVRRVTLSYGFIDIVNVPRCLAAAVARGQLLGTDLDKIIYYIGRENIIASGQMAGMALWRERLFAFMQRNAERTAAYFCIPAERVIEVGTELEI